MKTLLIPLLYPFPKCDALVFCAFSNPEAYLFCYLPHFSHICSNLKRKWHFFQRFRYLALLLPLIKSLKR